MRWLMPLVEGSILTDIFLFFGVEREYNGVPSIEWKVKPPSHVENTMLYAFKIMLGTPGNVTMGRFTRHGELVT